MFTEFASWTDVGLFRLLEDDEDTDEMEKLDDKLVLYFLGLSTFSNIVPLT